MAIDVNKAQEIQNGLRVSDNGTEGPFYTGGPTSPVGLDLPVDTIYVQNIGTGGVVVWRKYDTGVNDWVKAQPNDFMQKVTNDSETSTTSTTVWSTKLSLTTPSLPSGDYELEFMYRWRNSSANRRQDTRIQRNSVNVLTWESFNPNTAERSLQSGILHFTAISGVQVFTLDFKVIGSGTTTYMANAYMKFQRIA